MFSEELPHAGEQLQRIRAFVGRVAVREVQPDVPERRRAEQRVRDRVQQDVGVGVPEQPLFIWNVHAADDEPAPLREPVDVVSGSDPHEYIIFLIIIIAMA